MGTSKHNGYSKNVFETLRFAYQPYLISILTSLFIGFIGRLIILSSTNLVGLWIDSFCKIDCRPIPIWLSDFKNIDYIITLCALSLIGFALTLFFRVLFSRLSAKAVSTIYDEVTLRTSRFPLDFFDNNPTGRIITRFSSDYGNVFRLFGGPLAEFFSIIFDLIAMIILITIASPYYLIIVVFIGLMNFWVYQFNKQSLRDKRRKLSSSRSPAISHFAETIQGSSAIRVYNRQESFSQRFSELDQNYLDQKKTTSHHIFFFAFQMNSFSAILFLITSLSSIYLEKNHLVSIGSIGVAFGFISLSGNSIQTFFEWLTQLEEALVGVERLDAYLRTPIEIGSRLPASTKFPTNHPIYTFEKQENDHFNQLIHQESAGLCIHKLSFRYNKDSPWILKNINFEISAGEKIGIIGRTGSGKSTLISLMFYLYNIEEGYISIENHVPDFVDKKKGIDLNLFRRSISLIPQDPVLFIGTLRSNLDINDEFTDDKILSALKQVGLMDWILGLPEKLNFRIEERGKNISLGEKQLICMARCLLQKAPIVIMDEATSSVDPQSEELIVKATENLFKNKTQIIIAHRLSTLIKCDKVIWLDEGQIKMMGPANQVLTAFHSFADPRSMTQTK